MKKTLRQSEKWKEMVVREQGKGQSLCPVLYKTTKLHLLAHGKRQKKKISKRLLIPRKVRTK